MDDNTDPDTVSRHVLPIISFLNRYLRSRNSKLGAYNGGDKMVYILNDEASIEALHPVSKPPILCVNSAVHCLLARPSLFHFPFF